MAQYTNITWVANRDDEVPTISNSNYRPRKSHKKSRNGCQNCKQRRIKCDEARPCGQCLDRVLHCDFSDAGRSSISLLGISGASSSQIHISQASAREQIKSYLLQTDLSCTVNIELLDHFFKIDIPCIGSPECQRTLQQYGLQLSIGASYLLYAILAFSASHLSFLFPEQKKYGIAATINYDRSLASYLAEIRTGLDANNANAILGACHLHTMLAFRNVLSNNSAEGDLAFTWLRTMQGVGIMRHANNLGLFETIWQPIYIESRGGEEFVCHHSEFDEKKTWASVTSKALHQLCDIELSPSQTLKTNPYQKPLSLLCILLQYNGEHDKICLFMSTVGMLPSSFVELLYFNDPRAMLILSYWCALLSQIDQWWIVGSARAECVRLCTYLDTIPNQKIHDLLRYPARKCGYPIKDTKEGCILQQNF